MKKTGKIDKKNLPVKKYYYTIITMSAQTHGVQKEGGRYLCVKEYVVSVCLRFCYRFA